MNSPTPSLDGKVILITGGIGALGLGIVKRLTDAGARMAVGDLPPLQKGVAALRKADVQPGRFVYVQGDVARASHARRLVDMAFKEFGRLDVALCHAGIVEFGDLIACKEKTWDRHMAVNVKAAFLVAQESARRMIAASIPGKLVFTSSWVAERPWPGIGPYNASKAALNQMMRSFARELAPRGIRANSIAPGIVDAGMSKLQKEKDPVYYARMMKAIPLGCLQSLDSVADSFHFMCSDLSNYMTGAVLVVDGGCSLYPMD